MVNVTLEEKKLSQINPVDMKHKLIIAEKIFVTFLNNGRKCNDVEAEFTAQPHLNARFYWVTKNRNKTLIGLKHSN